MSAQPNVSQSAMAVLHVLDELTGFAATGATNKDLADACKTTPVAVSRAMATLIAYGWGRKCEETGRFFPAAQFTRLTFRVEDDFRRAANRLNDRRLSMTGFD